MQRAYGREREQRSKLDGLGLSEIEAVEYVLMLSRDEAHARENSGGPSSSANFEDGIFEGDFDEDVSDHSPGMSSPSLSASSSSSSLSSRPGHVLSPRYREAPVEAGLGNDSPPSSSLPFDTSDHDIFPHVSANASPRGAGTPSSSVGQAGGSHRQGLAPRSPTTSVWGNTRSISPATSPISRMNPWASKPVGVPTMGPTRSPPVWAVGGKRPATEEELDADLKFALELSLVEARSRGENV